MVSSTIDLLKDEYEIRHKKNNRYSLRRYAQQLKVSQSFLSLLFTKKRKLSRKKALEFLDCLNWSEQKKNYFMALYDLENSSSDYSKKIAREIIFEFSQASESMREIIIDQFETICDWRYSLVLVVISLRGFITTLDNISLKTNINKNELKGILRRLKKLKLVIFKDRQYQTSNNHFEVLGSPSLAIRNYHDSMLMRAKKALEQQNFTIRLFDNLTISFDPERLEEAKIDIVNFRKKFNQKYSVAEDKSVYQLSVQFFDLINLQ